MSDPFAMDELSAPITHAAHRVPDSVQRSPGDAQHRPVTLLRRAGTHLSRAFSWTPDQQRIACALRSIRGTFSKAAKQARRLG
jgi:hypothetical protein